MRNVREPSLAVLNETPCRVLQFLIGARFPLIRAILCTRGYGDDDEEEGWQLLMAAAGRSRPIVAVPVAEPARDAMDEVQAWGEPNLKIAKAALDRRHPEQSVFLFRQLKPVSGAWSLVAVNSFLDRIDALESGKGRKATREQDLAALASLAKKGITPEERKRARTLVRTAQSGPSMPPEDPQQEEASKADRLAALKELRAWYDEWAQVGRVLIKRKDHLIRLGLARRKAKRKRASEAATSGQGG